MQLASMLSVPVYDHSCVLTHEAVMSVLQYGWQGTSHSPNPAEDLRSCLHMSSSGRKGQTSTFLQVHFVERMHSSQWGINMHLAGRWR